MAVPLAPLVFHFILAFLMSCEQVAPDTRRVVVMPVAGRARLPAVRHAVGGNPCDVRESRIRDLPIGHRPLEVVWLSAATGVPSGAAAHGRCSSIA